MYNKIMELTDGELCDIVINNVNIENTEMASILACKDGGLVYFFSMATSFTKAALGAEGVGKDVDMIIGNGYTCLLYTSNRRRWCRISYPYEA